MEKLQSAIENARKRRQPDDGAPAARQPRAAAVPSDLAERWANLAPATTDPAILRKNRIVALQSCQEAMPFDVLRTKVQLLSKEHGWTRIAITSPMPASGKTTTACNLIAGLSRVPEKKSILFDFDMRRPNVHKLLGLSPAHSLKPMLTGEVSFQDQALRLRHNAAISCALSAENDPTPFLMSQQISKKLDEIEDEYQPDLMLFDLPPFLTGDESRAFLKNVDCALLVAAAGRSRTNDIDKCEREIADYTNVAGIVLNFCPPTSENEGHEYYGY